MDETREATEQSADLRDSTPSPIIVHALDTSSRSAPATNGAPPAEPLAMPATARKLQVPRLPPRLLTRAALLTRLRGWRDHRLTLIMAPAGYGKSTLAAGVLHDALRSPPFHARWLALDEDDDDPVRFVHSLSRALATLIPDAATDVSRLLRSYWQPRQALLRLLGALESLPTLPQLPSGNSPASTATPQPLGPGWGQARRRRPSDTPTLPAVPDWSYPPVAMSAPEAPPAAPVLLVLDDFHRVRTPAVHALFALALERTPDNLHWMLLTRHAAPVAISRLRLEGQVLELDAQDLRLTRAEIEEMLALAGDLDVEAAAIDLLEERTQGWPAALHLALLSMRRRPTTSHTDSARVLLHHLRGDNDMLEDYMVGEVLSHLEEPLRSFMLQCSILSRLHAGLCTAVTGLEESPDLLHAAIAQQLFVRPLDAEEMWYELHHLFRASLQRQLHQTWPNAQVQMLYRRAADWQLAQGDVTAALHALIDGDALQLAADLVQSRAHQAILHGYLTELRHWAGLLPAALIDARPRLLIDLTWLAYLTGLHEFRNALERTQTILKMQPSLPAPWQDELQALSLLLRYMDGDRRHLHRDALNAVAGFDTTSHLARGWAYIVAIFISSQAPGSPTNEYVQQAAAAFSTVGFARGSIYALGWQALHALGLGDATEIADVCAQAVSLLAPSSRLDPSEYTPLALMAGQVHYWQNRIDDAADHFERALTNAQAYEDDPNIVQAHACLGLCTRLTGAPPPTPINSAQHWRIIDDKCAPDARATVAYWEMWHHQVAGAPQAAWAIFQKMGLSLENVPADAPDMVWLALLTAYVTSGRNLTQLTPALEMLTERTQAANWLHISIRAQLLSVRQQVQIGRRSAARSLLRAALRDVERTGYVRMVLDQPELFPVLRRVDTEYARQVLALIDAAAQVRPVSPLTTQETTILRLRAEKLTGRQIAERLVLAPSTVKWHLRNIYAKLGVQNGKEAVAVAQRAGLLA